MKEQIYEVSVPFASGFGRNLMLVVAAGEAEAIEAVRRAFVEFRARHCEARPLGRIASVGATAPEVTSLDHFDKRSEA